MLISNSIMNCITATNISSGCKQLKSTLLVALLVTCRCFNSYFLSYLLTFVLKSIK